MAERQRVSEERAGIAADPGQAAGRPVRNRPKPEEVVVPPRREQDVAPPFPPRREFSSLSLRDLLDARDAYHVHLSHLENVVATAGDGVRLWDLHDPAHPIAVATIRSGANAPAGALGFDPAGSLLVTDGPGFTVRL